DWLAEERALGHQEGHEEGRKEGHEEGRKEGHEEGLKEGHEEGRKEGHIEGHIEGRKEGRKEVLWENVTALFEYGMGAEDVSAALKIGLEPVKERYEVWNKKRNVEVPA
ncbi:MAG: hypothetical protein IJ374_10635, partial [Lachnospiraceae bacterium]|nr:hypothetical protein [Lachnospiraceae bacterium]